MRILKFVAILPVILMELIMVVPVFFIKSIGGLLAIIRVWCFREYDYRQWLERDLADCESILELGCGPPLGFLQTISPLLQIGLGMKTDAFDIWQPYIEKHKKDGNFRKCWQADILQINLSAKAYDAVVIFDVLEHLPKEKVEQMDLFAMMEKCARKKVIVFTPNGFIENDEVDNDPWQKHLSAWEPEDYLKRGYKVVGTTGLRYLFGKASLPKYRPHSVCAIIGMVTMALVYHKPNFAWHSYAVKVLEK